MVMVKKKQKKGNGDVSQQISWAEKLSGYFPGKFLKWVAIGLFLIALPLITFVFGFLAGRWQLQKEQVCFRPSLLPVALRRVVEEGLGRDFLAQWQGRTIFGKVVSVDLNQLVLETSDGQREVEINNQTRYLRGRSPIKKGELVKGQTVVILLDNEKKEARIVIVVKK